MPYLQYTNFSLPKTSDPNFWADHIEFLCLFSLDGYITKDSIRDRIQDENVHESSRAVSDMIEDEEFPNLVFSDHDINDSLIEDETYSDTFNDSLSDDKIDSKINSYFEILSSRDRHFKDDYPFTLKPNNLKLKDELSTNQLLYVILLCSSLLRLATKSGLNKLGHHFEELCGPAFDKLTPNDTINLFFGSGTSSKFKSIRGSFYDKVHQLCNYLHCEPHSNFTKANAGIHNVGDGGIDWIGIYDFGDNQSSLPTFVGQCACGSDWEEKQFDAHISKWRNYIQLSNHYLSYHFIPKSFRDVSLAWHNPTSIIDVILIDRFRLIDLLKTEPNLKETLEYIYGEFIEEITTEKIDSFS